MQGCLARAQTASTSVICMGQPSRRKPAPLQDGCPPQMFLCSAKVPSAPVGVRIGKGCTLRVEWEFGCPPYSCTVYRVVRKGTPQPLGTEPLPQAISVCGGPTYTPCSSPISVRSRLLHGVYVGPPHTGAGGARGAVAWCTRCMIVPHYLTPTAWSYSLAHIFLYGVTARKLIKFQRSLSMQVMPMNTIPTAQIAWAMQGVPGHERAA